MGRCCWLNDAVLFSDPSTPAEAQTKVDKARYCCCRDLQNRSDMSIMRCAFRVSRPRVSCEQVRTQPTRDDIGAVLRGLFTVCSNVISIQPFYSVILRMLRWLPLLLLRCPGLPTFQSTL